MPALLAFLSFVGMLAMLWVGGGILLHGLAEFGIDRPEHLLESISEGVRQSTPVGAAFFSWLATASAAAVVGLAVGALMQMVMALTVAPFRRS
jgi:hypothetical protein